MSAQGELPLSIAIFKQRRSMCFLKMPNPYVEC